MIGICGKFTIYCSAGREFLSPELKFILGVLTNQEDAEAQKNQLRLSQFLKPLLKLFLHGRGEINYKLIQDKKIFHIFFNLIDLLDEGSDPTFLYFFRRVLLSDKPRVGMILNSILKHIDLVRPEMKERVILLFGGFVRLMIEEMIEEDKIDAQTLPSWISHFAQRLCSAVGYLVLKGRSETRRFSSYE